MTVPRLVALLKYWKHAPPLHETFARFVGIDPPAQSTPELVDDGKKLVDELLGAGVHLHDGPSWAEQDAAFRATTPALDVEITPPESP